MNLAVQARWLAALGGALVASARAETVLAVPVAPGTDAALKVALVPAQPPRFGFAPMRVTIENAAPQERTWRFDFRAGPVAASQGTVRYSRSFTVPAGQTRETWVFVPVAEAGEPGAAPALSAAGVSAPSTPPGTIPGTTVSITKTPTGTQVVRSTVSPATGVLLMKEETTIDETTGELRAVTTSPTGSINNTRSSKPPPGSSVTYTIDAATGFVSSRFSNPAGGGTGPTRVTILTSPQAASAARGPITPTKVTIEPTPVGTRITRVMSTGSGLPGARTYTEEKEIDAQTGIITTTMSSPTGTMMPPRTSPPLPLGTETTYTINPTTGSIGTTTRIGANPKAPPKVTIVTGPAPVAATAATAASGPATKKSSGRTTARPPLSGFAGPPMNLVVEVNGPGVNGGRVTFSSLGATANMRPIAAPLAVERPLREGLNNEGIRTPNLTVLDPLQLPADWRTWSPYATVLLPVDDFAGLDAARRAALRGWVALGGQLLLVPAAPGKRWAEPLGAGAIVTLAAPLSASPDAAELMSLGISLGGTVAQPDAESLALRRGSALGDALADRESHVTWLTVFLVLFAVLIGPVNLYVLAPAAKRHRLFVTTPLIAFAAALVLGGTILVQDGTGGVGERRTLVALVPGDNAAAVIQEQTSLSGLLLSSGFPLAADVQLTGLAFAETQTPLSALVAGPTLERDDVRAGPGWFRSRTRQAHLVQRLVPTRGRVERVGTAPGGAPIVQSSLAVPLRNFAFVDENLVVWSARELAPGRRVALERGGQWPADLAKSLGGSRRFDAVAAAVARQHPGRWVARGVGGELGPVATHAAIRWRDADVTYAGVLEGAGAKEAKP